MPTWIKQTSFYALVAVIFVLSVFPFYYAVVTSFKSGQAIFDVDYWPTSFSLTNYFTVLTQGVFGQQILNSILVATGVVMISLVLAVGASYALSRIAFRGKTLMLFTILSVSMFPQIAVLAGLFELIRSMGIYNSLWSLVFSYMIFTLPFTVWVLTTFMKALPVEIEEAAIVDGATPVEIIIKVFLPLMWPRFGHHWLVGVYSRLERIFVRFHLYGDRCKAHRACGHCDDFGRV